MMTEVEKSSFQEHFNCDARKNLINGIGFEYDSPSINELFLKHSKKLSDEIPFDDNNDSGCSSNSDEDSSTSPDLSPKNSIGLEPLLVRELSHLPHSVSSESSDLFDFLEEIGSVENESKSRGSNNKKLVDESASLKNEDSSFAICVENSNNSENSLNAVPLLYKKSHLSKKKQECDSVKNNDENLSDLLNDIDFNDKIVIPDKFKSNAGNIKLDYELDAKKIKVSSEKSSINFDTEIDEFLSSLSIENINNNHKSFGKNYDCNENIWLPDLHVTETSNKSNSSSLPVSEDSLSDLLASITFDDYVSPHDTTNIGSSESYKFFTENSANNKNNCKIQSWLEPIDTEAKEISLATLAAEHFSSNQISSHSLKNNFNREHHSIPNEVQSDLCNPIGSSVKTNLENNHEETINILDLFGISEIIEDDACKNVSVQKSTSNNSLKAFDSNVIDESIDCNSIDLTSCFKTDISSDVLSKNEFLNEKNASLSPQRTDSPDFLFSPTFVLQKSSDVSIAPTTRNVNLKESLFAKALSSKLKKDNSALHKVLNLKNTFCEHFFMSSIVLQVQKPKKEVLQQSKDSVVLSACRRRFDQGVPCELL